MRTYSLLLLISMGLMGLVLQASQPRDLKQIPTPQLIQEILADYKIKGPDDCITYRTKKMDIPKERFGDEYPQACVVAGMKRVFVPEETSAAEIFKTMNPKIKELLERKDGPIGYFEAPLQGIPTFFMYTKARGGKLMAYKLAKYHMQIELENKQPSWYLIGRLLDYPEDAIKFFYELHKFGSQLPQPPTQHNYDKWPADLKVRFEAFKKEWPSSAMYKHLQELKKEADEFLAKRGIAKTLPIKLTEEQVEETEANPYLIGWAFGDTDTGIESKLMMTNFLSVHSTPAVTEKNYHQWPQDLKKKFDEFEKTSDALADFNTDKKTALQWLQENSRKSIPQLMAEVKKLERQIVVQKPQPETPPVIPPTPPVVPPVKPPVITPGEPGKVSLMDYDPQRDFAEIKHIFDTLDAETIKVFGREIPEVISKYPKGTRNQKMYLLDGSTMFANIKVLRTDKNLVGFILSKITEKGGKITECKIAPIVIAKEFQGHGYSKLLMQSSIDFFTNEHCKSITLDVHPNNTKAIKLYDKMGFKEIARDPDTVTMELVISTK